MIDVVFRYTNETAFFNRLVALGLSVRTGKDENGHDYRTEELMGLCSTPVLEDVDGNKYLCSRLADDGVKKFPPSNNPVFTIIWRSDLYIDDGEGNMVQEPWPTVEVQAYGIDGNPDGARMQGVGRIA